MKTFILLSACLWAAVGAEAVSTTGKSPVHDVVLPEVYVQTDRSDKNDMEADLDALAKTNQWRKFADVMDDYLKKYGYPTEQRFYNWMVNLKVSNIDRSVSKKAIKWIDAHVQTLRKQIAESDELTLPQVKHKQLDEYISAYQRIAQSLKG